MLIPMILDKHLISSHIANKMVSLTLWCFPNPDFLGFTVSPEAIELLNSEELINQKLGVIAVAGKYRTGKSFLLNRILLNKRGYKSGFGVGPTINPCTKGLWIWSKPIEILDSNNEKIKVLIIDSEGIGAFNEDENHDTRIFLLALLLSSYFIYNSMGTIDENAL